MSDNVFFLIIALVFFCLGLFFCLFIPAILKRYEKKGGDALKKSKIRDMKKEGFIWFVVFFVGALFVIVPSDGTVIEKLGFMFYFTYVAFILALGAVVWSHYFTVKSRHFYDY